MGPSDNSLLAGMALEIRKTRAFVVKLTLARDAWGEVRESPLSG
jgi:hypothetical protein